MINEIYNENNLITMLKMPNSFVDGIITSPPYGLRMNTKRKDCYYNNGYSDIDNLTEDEYIKTRIEEFIQFQRIVKDEGVILYNISYNNANAILPLLLLTEVHKQTNLTVVDMISWSKNTNIPFQTSPNLLSRKVEQVYVIVKKDRLHKFKTNKEVSKINEKTGQKFYKGYNNLIEAKNNDGIICDLKASYSTELVSKLINIYFPQQSVIYDPFSGIGTTSVACKKLGLNYIGSEINEKFWKIGNDRLK
jgi:site-specific DNA-methyltransferase (adenine-specific)